MCTKYGTSYMVSSRRRKKKEVIHMKEFEKIIGYEGIKKELIKISDVLKNNEAYKKLGVTAPRGLMLHGEPGVGKTLMASALIEASGRKAIICRKDKPNGDFVKALPDDLSARRAGGGAAALCPGARALPPPPRRPRREAAGLLASVRSLV